MTNERRADLSALRNGDAQAIQDALSHYAPWLRLLARHQVETQFQRKFDPSDVAQQAMIEALGSFESFEGKTEAELAAWLRKILAHVLSHEVRRFRGTKKRDMAREQSLDHDLEQTAIRFRSRLAANDPSPSAQAINRELEFELAKALEHLSEDYREVIILRNLEGLPHEEIAKRIGRSPGATRMLWVRALAELRSKMQPDSRPNGL
ncbi:MAG: sigma-70 family RNA polymerase sigma factor [Planctomycetota bacterium]|nr:sigma-70 family RNA polymerase sigma factor [Planctomycetota bacterium]